jgi:hypothetical protein
VRPTRDTPPPPPPPQEATSLEAELHDELQRIVAESADADADLGRLYASLDRDNAQLGRQKKALRVLTGAAAAAAARADDDAAAASSSATNGATAAAGEGGEDDE